MGVCNLLTRTCLEGGANVALEPWEILLKVGDLAEGRRFRLLPKDRLFLGFFLQAAEAKHTQGSQSSRNP